MAVGHGILTHMDPSPVLDMVEQTNILHAMHANYALTFPFKDVAPRATTDYHLPNVIKRGPRPYTRELRRDNGQQ